MTNLRGSILLVFIGMLLPIVMSCAEMKSWISPKSSVQTSVPVKDSSQTSRRTSSRQAANLVKKDSAKTSAPVKNSSQISIQVSAQAVNLAKEHMEAGECQKAIDVYNVEYQKHPHDLSLAREYVKSIENIASAADKALDKKDFASAGRNYDVLLKNYAHFKGFEKKLSFNSIALNEKLCYCKKAIFKQGFQEYRKGNLSEAIALWQDLLVIDPQNTDIKKALRTATLQQKNLQEKE
jgi:tetratricopeptide (TPR) repeat protein